MSKVPERFLGFAFTVGDILLEVDNNLQILNADGAISALSKDQKTPVMGRQLRDIVSEQDFAMLELTISGLDMASRIGPLLMHIGIDEDARKEFAVFAGRLPMYENAVYLALSYPYRLGLDEDADSQLSDEEKKDRFFAKLDSLLHKHEEHEDNLMVTVLETGGETDLTKGKEKELEKFLKSFSVGGSTAAKLSENKFALVHEKGETGDQQDMIAENITKATGIDLNSASIDAQEAVGPQDDGIKALVFSLQKFAEGTDKFTMDDFQKKGGSLIADTTQKVSMFRDILSTGNFNFVFQPIVSLMSGTTHHFEALSRMDLKTPGMNQFEMICFAEDVGLIMDFDKAVLRRAIDMIKPKMGMASCPKIAVNVSGKSLSNEAFITDLLKQLKSMPSLGRNLSIEVTESSKINDLEQLNKILGEIRGHGFRVYLDDFGAGVSGFQYLKQLQVDGVKIDGEYVRDATRDQTTKAFLMSMATLCQQIGVETVAEWVEEKEQVDLLSKIGVTYAQGYYFGRPSESLTPSRARAAG